MRTPAGERLKVPHLGWSPVRQAQPHPLWQGIGDLTRFYFAHSYYPAPADSGSSRVVPNYPTPFTCVN
jgi:glutamine amidotransferase